MREFRKIVDLPPARLRKSDVRELANLLVEAAPDNRVSSGFVEPYSFSIEAGEITLKADSIEQLLSQELPKTADTLVISVVGWAKDRGIDRGVTVRVGRQSATAQVHSTNEIWFQGITQKILHFFQHRRSWYSKIHFWLPSFMGMITGGCIAACVALLAMEKPVTAAFAFITIVALFCCSKWIVTGRLFPTTDIRFGDQRKVDSAVLGIVVAAIGVSATVVGVAFEIIREVSK